jgi:hypothetical protein
MLFVLPESAKKTPFLEVDEYWLDHTAHFSLVTRTDVPGSMKSMMARSATFLQSVVSALNPVKSSSTGLIKERALLAPRDLRWTETGKRGISFGQ